MRPDRLEDFIGQEHILGPGKPLRRQIERDELSSIILWGPPGVGKTTLAKLIARMTRCEFLPFSAVLSGIKEIKAVMADAERLRRAGRRTILFIDEIHRFNKAQQDAFLPYVERGDIILIGATTENPSFEVIAALLSRSRVYALRALTVPEIVTLLRARPAGGGPGSLRRTAGADRHLLQRRRAAGLQHAGGRGGCFVRASSPKPPCRTPSQRKVLLYDKGGEEHFNLISALHKSVRSSDVDAALYWLDAHAGSRRGPPVHRAPADSHGHRRYRAGRSARAGTGRGGDAGGAFSGHSGRRPGAGAGGHLPLAWRRNPTPRTGPWAPFSEDVERTIAEPVPMNLRNAVTRHMKAWGYGEGYQHAHKFEDAMVDMECLPPSLAGRRYYFPTGPRDGEADRGKAGGDTQAKSPAGRRRLRDEPAARKCVKFHL